MINLLIGTYSQPILHGTGKVLMGRGEGIYSVTFDDKTGCFSNLEVLARTPNASFLAVTPRLLYAVNELKEYEGVAQGSLSVFTRDGDALGVYPTGGADPCHVALSADGKVLAVANFMSGSVLLSALGSNRLPETSHLFEYAGHSVDPIRQSCSHAHSTTFRGRFAYVPDLGLDQIHVFAVNSGMVELDRFDAPPGSGPRYCEFHPTNRLLYCLNELNSTIQYLRADAHTGTLTDLGSASTRPDCQSGASIGGTLRIAPDGRHVYASNRGDDSIAVLDVAPNGGLCLASSVPSGGCTPRDFTIDPAGNYLIVANQDSDNLVSFKVCDDGHLLPCDELAVPTPVCVVIA